MADSFDDVVSGSSLPETSVVLCLDGTLQRRLEELAEQLVEAQRFDERHNEPDRAPAVRDQIEQLQARARDAEVEFVLRALPRKRWSDLLAEHPATKEQKEQRLDHNPETFWPPVMAESIVTPQGATAEKVADWAANQLTDGQWQTLVQAVWQLNRGSSRSPLSERISTVLLNSSKS